MRPATFFLALLAIYNRPAAGQGEAPRFEVASVKPADPRSAGASMRFDPGSRLVITGMTLQNLITLSYGIRDYQLRGAPAWIASAKFDIIATPPAPVKTAGSEAYSQQMLRIRALLASRFQLTVHHELERRGVLVLTASKGGPKLPAEQSGGVCPGGRGVILPVRMLATDLSLRLDQPVVDETGLNGNYCILLNWTSDDGRPQAIGAGAAAASGRTPELVGGPSLFTALEQQAGLKLQARKAPIDILVIDRVAQPTAN